MSTYCRQAVLTSHLFSTSYRGLLVACVTPFIVIKNRHECIPGTPMDAPSPSANVRLCAGAGEVGNVPPLGLEPEPMCC